MDASLLTGASILTAAQGGTGGGTGTASVSSSDSFITANPTTGAVVVGQRIVANWNPDPNLWVVYAIDYDAGNDGNAGAAIPNTTSLADFQAAVALAGANAKKTMQGLGAILPVDGAGRNVIICIASRAAGASYLKQDGVTVDSLDSFMAGRDGYSNIYIWATGTNATAGATKFTGTVADFTYAGAIPVTGTNAPGYNPTGTISASTVPCLQVGGAAPALAAEPLPPLGWRARYDSATTTVALRNICRSNQIISTTTTTRDTVSPETNWPAAPVAADLFYLEQAGVVCNGWGNGWGAANARVVIVGVRSLTLVNYLTGSPYVNRLVHMFCGFGGATALGSSVGAITNFAGPSTIGNIRCGSTIHVAGNVLFQPSTAFPQQHSMVIEGTTLYEFEPGGVNDAGFVFGGRVTFQGGTGCLAGNNPMIGNASSGLACRSILNGVLVQGCRLNLKDLAITNAGANPALALQGQNILFLQGPSGSTGNSDVGLDLTLAQGSTIVLNGGPPTVTGTNGDVRLSDGNVISWAQAMGGVTDPAGNTIVSTGGTLPGSPLEPWELRYSGFFVNDPVFTSGTPSAELPAGHTTVLTTIAWRYNIGRSASSLKLVYNVLQNTLNGAGASFTINVLKNGVSVGTSGAIPSGSLPATQAVMILPATLGASNRNTDVYSLQLAFTSVVANVGNTVALTAGIVGNGCY